MGLLEKYVVSELRRVKRSINTFISKNKNFILSVKTRRLKNLEILNLRFISNVDIAIVLNRGSKCISHADIRETMFNVNAHEYVFITMFASRSALKFSTLSDMVTLILLSKSEIYGTLSDITKKIIAGIANETNRKFVVCREFYPQTYEDATTLQQKLVVHQYLIETLLGFLDNIRSRISARYFRRKLRTLNYLLKRDVHEVDINRYIIFLFKTLNFTVLDISNTPGNADVAITKPLPIVIEVKKGRASSRDLAQLRKFVEYYSNAMNIGRELRLYWLPILVSEEFSEDMISVAEGMGVVLVSFRALIKLLELLAIYGITLSELRAILVPGEADRKIIELYRKRRKEFILFRKLIRQIYGDVKQLMENIKAKRKLIGGIATEVFIEALKYYPFNLLEENGEKINPLARCYIIRLLNRLFR